MRYVNTTYANLAKKIKEEKKKIVVYGAGVIGQVTFAHFVRKYSLHNYVLFYVDSDKKKQNTSISIDEAIYHVFSPNCLFRGLDDVVIVITNSKYQSVIDFLESVPSLNTVEGFIVPIMQLKELENCNVIDIERYLDNEIIPKIIHYCWFGRKEKPDFLKYCIDSWKRYCPDYEIVEWNEDNYDVEKHKYSREAYENMNYGFVSDVARWDILYENGGIYFDTDVELIREIDECLYQKGFIATEKWGNINSGGGCGFEKGHPIVKQMIDYRDKYSFRNSDGSINFDTNGWYETKFFEGLGYHPDNSLQIINGVTIYPSYVNHPYDYLSGEVNKCDSTISIHHFYGGWMSEDDMQNREITRERYHKFVGNMENDN